MGRWCASGRRNLIEAIERDVTLVAINGCPCYRTATLMKPAGAQHAERIEVGGLEASHRSVYDGILDADMSWKQVISELDHARKHPEQRWA